MYSPFSLMEAPQRMNFLRQNRIKPLGNPASLCVLRSTAFGSRYRTKSPCIDFPP